MIFLVKNFNKFNEINCLFLIRKFCFFRVVFDCLWIDIFKMSFDRIE